MIRIKVAVIDARESYLRKLLQAFSSEYSDRLEIFAFSTVESAEAFLKTKSVDVLLVSSEFADEGLEGKGGAVLAYLTDNASVDTIFGHRAICRFQKTEMIYKGILDVCSGKFDHVREKSAISGSSKIIVFFSAGGGVGASTLAAACAIGAAKRGLKAFYLNLEVLGSSTTFFRGSGNGGLEDILFAIGAKKSNVGMRLQMLAKTSPHGVRFLDSCENIADVLDMTGDQLEVLVQTVASSERSDVIVLDADFAMTPLAMATLNIAHLSVFVSNGTEVSNRKFERAYQMLQVLRQRGEISSNCKVALAYNNFRSKWGKRPVNDLVPVVGTIGHVVRDAQGTPLSAPTLADALSTQPLFNPLLSKGV